MVVQLKYATLPAPLGAFAVHYWFTVLDPATGGCDRWEIWQSKDAGGTKDTESRHDQREEADPVALHVLDLRRSDGELDRVLDDEDGPQHPGEPVDQGCGPRDELNDEQDQPGHPQDEHRAVEDAVDLDEEPEPFTSDFRVLVHPRARCRSRAAAGG